MYLIGQPGEHYLNAPISALKIHSLEAFF